MDVDDVIIADLPRLSGAEWHRLGSETARLGERFRTGAVRLEDVPSSSIVPLKLKCKGVGPTVYTTLGSEVLARARRQARELGETDAAAIPSVLTMTE